LAWARSGGESPDTAASASALLTKRIGTVASSEAATIGSDIKDTSERLQRADYA
jgi:hypothetical protein